MARRPRVLMVSGNAPPALDGVGDYAARLLEELHRQRPGWRWLWLSRRPRWFHPPLVVRGGVPLFRPAHTWAGHGQALAAAAARALRPDLVHVQEQIHSFYETGAACRVADAVRAPLVVTLHEYHVELPSVRHTDELVRRARVVISNDPRNAARCLERTGRAVDHHWWSSATVLPPDPATRRPPRPGLVVTFGFLSAIKALGPVYHGLERLRAAKPELGLRWRIIGPFDPGDNPHHAELAATFSPEWVEFTGAVEDHDRLRALLAEGSAMLLPFADGASTRRGTLHVAWAFGLPVVTTPPTTPTDAVEDEENCLLVPEPTAEAWAFAVGRVLGDPALAGRLRAGAAAAADRFSWARLAEAHLALYDGLIGGR